MNSKSKDLLNIAQQFEQDAEDAEASLLADILRIIADKDFSDLVGLRDRMVRDENPNFHPFRLPSGIPQGDAIAAAKRFTRLGLDIRLE